MPNPKLYVAITNHGFGHATRIASVAATIQRRCPEIELIVTTTAPQWLIAGYLGDTFTYRQQAFDVGVLQRDSLQMDLVATLQQLQQIQAEAAALVQSEAAFLQQQQVGLVLADIPPLATRIAHAAGVPCWMMSNFGWDFIYEAWEGEFTAIAAWIKGCFAECDRLFRLPFHEPMSAFPTMEDVGLTGGTPNYNLDDLRAEFELTAPRSKTILLTFGGLGLEAIPYDALSQFPDWQFITFDRQAPPLPNLRPVQDKRYRPVDFMPLCDRIVSKPGFSTFAEACRLDLPITTITREGFAESALLIEGVQDYANHQILAPETFFQGAWEFLREDPQPPRRSAPLDKTGNDAIATAVIDYLLNPAC